MSEWQAKPGQFCWAELMTTDSEAACGFYQSFTGWTRRTDVMPRGGFYHTFLYEGLEASACSDLTPQMRAHGIAPHWLASVRVEDVDAVAEKARAAGGQIQVEPRAAGPFGWFAVITDPQGATFALWQPKTHFGARNGHFPGRHCWTELLVSDTAAAADFYKQVFGWDTHEADMGGTPYTTWVAGGGPVGGMLAKPPGREQAPCHWMVYFSVPSLETALNTLRQRGGVVCVEPFEVAGVGVMAPCLDPQGAAFSLIELRMNS